MKPSIIKCTADSISGDGYSNFFRAFMKNSYKNKFITIEDCAYIAHCFKENSEIYDDFLENIKGLKKMQKGVKALENINIKFYIDNLNKDLKV